MVDKGWALTYNECGKIYSPGVCCPEGKKVSQTEDEPMKRFAATLRTVVAILIVVAMSLSMVSCAALPKTAQNDGGQIVLDNTDRQQQESIVTILGDGTYNPCHQRIMDI